MNRRDEVKEKIRQGLFCKPDRVFIKKGESDNVLEDVMSELDSLVERWTDEETAEDLDKSIGESEVYEGMRVRLTVDIRENQIPEQIPEGAKGIIVHPDKDGSPGVLFDNRSYNLCTRAHSYGDKCTHVSLNYLQEIPND